MQRQGHTTPLQLESKLLTPVTAHPITSSSKAAMICMNKTRIDIRVSSSFTRLTFAHLSSRKQSTALGLAKCDGWRHSPNFLTRPYDALAIGCVLYCTIESWYGFCRCYSRTLVQASNHSAAFGDKDPLYVQSPFRRAMGTLNAKHLVVSKSLNAGYLFITNNGN